MLENSCFLCIFVCVSLGLFNFFFLHPNPNRESFATLYMSVRNFDGRAPWFILHTNKAYHISMKVVSGFQALCTCISQYAWQYVLSYQMDVLMEHP